MLGCINMWALTGGEPAVCLDPIMGLCCDDTLPSELRTCFAVRDPVSCPEPICRLFFGTQKLFRHSLKFSLFTWWQ